MYSLAILVAAPTAERTPSKKSISLTNYVLYISNNVIIRILNPFFVLRKKDAPNLTIGIAKKLIVT